jgi:hypothetical protein
MDRFTRGVFEAQPQFPIAAEEMFRKQLSGPLNSSEHPNSRLLLSMLPWNTRRDVATEDDIYCDFLVGEYAPHEVRCFNPKTNKFVGLTDALWRASVLTAHAFETQKSYGCFTWVNMRPFVNDNSVGCVAAQCSVVAEGITYETTVGELEKRLRNDFVAKLKRGYCVGGIKSIIDNVPTPRPPSVFFDVSNVGYFPTVGPFVDAWGQMTPRARFFTDNIGLSSVTTYGNENAKLTLRYPYSQFVFTRAEASRAFRAIVHSVKNIGPEMKVGDAIRELREVVG